MSTIKVLLVFSLLVGGLKVNAQKRGDCGMEPEDLKAVTVQLLKNKEMLRQGLLTPRAGVTYVPVAFHLVADDNGAGRALESDLLDMLCQINVLYKGLNIQFYLSAFRYINSSVVYNTPKGFAGSNLIANNKVNNAVNIFITLNATASTDQGQILGYYSPGNPIYSNDWVVLIKSQANGANAATGAHEIGHFFSMLHTFNGWEAGGYSANSCAPFTSPGGTPTEFASRVAGAQNCETAGDFICDTPPDYNFGFGNNGCSYTATAKDPNCIQVHPDTSNLMGYFIGCESTFSPVQQQHIIADLTTNPSRAYVRTGVVPDQTDLTAPVLSLPAEAGTTTLADQVNFSWAGVPKAAKYIVEISRSKSFNLQPVRIITDQTTLTVDNKTYPNAFYGGLTYYWRVRPYNSYKACAAYSAVGSFTTSLVSGVADIAGVNSLEVSPNPLRRSQQLAVRLNSEAPIKGVLKLYNQLGQLILQQYVDFAAGSSEQWINTDQLQTGLYILTLESGNGVMSKKVIVGE